MGTSSEILADSFSKIKKTRIEHINNVIIGNLNINSSPNKFDKLKVVVNGMLDILIITETKLDDTFPVSQFHIDGFSKPYRLDRNRNGGGVIIYVREDIPSKILTKHVLPTDIEALFTELNFRKCKWLLSGINHPPSQSDQYFFDRLDNALDVYSNYENILLVGDFNVLIGETCLDTFLYQHELKNVNKKPTCYKNSKNPSCIGFILTNNPRSFFKMSTLFTGLSDFHKLVLSVLKTTFCKSKPKEIIYRNLKNFEEESFNQELKNNLINSSTESYEFFEKVFLDTLNKNAPLKKKSVRANHASYVVKESDNEKMKFTNNLF